MAYQQLRCNLLLLLLSIAMLGCAALRQVRQAPELLNKSRRSCLRHATSSTQWSPLEATFRAADGIRSAVKRRPAVWGTAIGLGGVLLVTGTFAVGMKDPTKTASEVDIGDRNVLKTLPLSKLLSGWFVYSCCSIPFVVDASPTILDVLSRLPVISSIANAVIRQTFFAQFCGGETAQDCKSTVYSLRDRRIGSLLSCRLEASEDGSIASEAEMKQRFQDVLDGIEASGECERKYVSPADMAAGSTRSWISLKMSGLLADHTALIRASQAIVEMRSQADRAKAYYPGVPVDGDYQVLVGERKKLSQADVDEMRKLMHGLRMLAKRSVELGVRIFIDAEQTWYQPATDVIQEQLMREYNRNRVPIICGTVQAYLRRCDQYLQHAFDRAAQGGNSFGYKLVRGAYMTSEAKRPKPLLNTKAQTDACYDRAVEASVAQIAKNRQDPRKYADVCFMIASHNVPSTDHTISLFIKHGLGKRVDARTVLLDSGVGDRVSFAQICGMKDALTNGISSRVQLDNGLPAVVKLLPFGTLKNSMPYLARRAVENKAVMSGEDGAAQERRRLGDEVFRRIGLA